MRYPLGRLDTLPIWCKKVVWICKGECLMKNMGVGGYCVYLHRRATDGSVFYVGKGTLSRSRKTSSRSERWFAVYDKHGIDVEIDSKWVRERDALARENELIDLYSGSIVNIRRSRL